jgi:hypothetical protein
MLTSFIVIYAIPFAQNAAVQKQSLQIGELFIALTNWRFTMLLFSSLVILWFGDLPIVEPFTANALLRGSRRAWISGQVFYVLVSSFTLCVFIFIITVVISLPNVNVLNEWSRSVKLLATSGRIAISPERMRLSMPKELVNSFTPWSAFINSFLLFFSMCFIYGITTIVLRLRYRSGSFILLLLINAASWSTGMFSKSEKGYAYMSMISLHYHTALAPHAFHEINSLLPTLSVSYSIIISFSIAVIVMLMNQAKKYDFGATEEH